MLALMISPIRSIPICEVSCEHDSITEVAGDGEILIMLQLDFADFMPRSRELLYRRHAGEAAGKSGGSQGQAVALPVLPAGLIYDDRDNRMRLR